MTTRTNKQLSQALSEIRHALRGAGDPLTEQIERLLAPASGAWLVPAGDKSVRDQVERALDQVDADALAEE